MMTTGIGEPGTSQVNSFEMVQQQIMMVKGTMPTATCIIQIR